MLVYAVMHLPMILLMALSSMSNIWRSLSWVFTLLPLIPLVPALRALMNELSTFDEYQQMIQLRAVAFSLACTSLLSFSWGMLVSFSDAPHLNTIFILPMAVFFWMLGTVWARRKYQ
jgi:hypothetical protein